MKTKMFASASRICVYVLFLLAGLRMSGAQVYSITDLGALSRGKNSTGAAINGLGQVVGRSEVVTSAGTRQHAFLWTRSAGMRDLGTFPGGIDQPVFASWADSINSLGHIGGGSWIDLERDDAFVWTKSGGMQGLGAVGVGSSATGINDRGQVAVTAGPSPAPPRALLWSKKGGLLELGTLPGGVASYANGINNLGQVVGSSNFGGVPPSVYHAVLWTKSGGPDDLGTLGGANSSAAGISDLGRVVGTSYLPTYSQHAFLWTRKGGMRDLGTLPGGTDSGAAAISIFGNVVGWSNSASSSNLSHAFLWTPRTGIWDLNDLIPANSGWLLFSASGINAWGQIVGTGTIKGQAHAFLLTPDLRGKR